MPFLVDSPHGIPVPLPDSGGLGHSFEDAPDGGTYFAVLGPSIDLAISLRNLERTQAVYNSFPQGRGRDQAAALRVIEKELETAVHASGVATAQYAEHTAKTLLEQRIVRPATPKPDHLKDAIVCRSIGPQSYGAVGIGDISELNRFPYWRAQEFGSTHLVGKTLRGFFIGTGGDKFAPDPGRSRKDPVFRVGGGPKMIVENPIKGKAFLTEATFGALEFRYRVWRNVERAAIGQITRVTLATAGDLAGIRYSGTVGGFASLARFRGPKLP